MDKISFHFIKYFCRECFTTFLVVYHTGKTRLISKASLLRNDQLFTINFSHLKKCEKF